MLRSAGFGENPEEFGENLGGFVLNPLAGAHNPLAGVLQPLAGGHNPLAGVLNPLAGVLNPLAGVLQPLAGARNPLAGAHNPLAGGAFCAMLPLCENKGMEPEERRANAQEGLRLLKEAVLDMIRETPGIRPADIRDELGLSTPNRKGGWKSSLMAGIENALETDGVAEVRNENGPRTPRHLYPIGDK